MRKIGPAMPSSSGGFPAATSFCIELRDTGGTLSKNRMKLAGSSGVPLAVAAAQASYMASTIRFRHTGSLKTSPMVIPDAVVVRAHGARIASLFHNIFSSSVLNWQLNPNCRNFSIVDASRVSPIEDTVRRAEGDRAVV